MGTHPPLYKAIWYWTEDCLEYSGVSEGKEKKAPKQQQTRQDAVAEQTIQFLENVDQNQQKIYKQKYQRTVKPNDPCIVTVQDIKDVVTYLFSGRIPIGVLSLFHSHHINHFFRALIVYMQLYLQVWDDLIYRKTSYAQQRLKHPVSVVRENLCRTYLSILRCRIGQEYALLIAGEGRYKRYHHMNNTINRSYTAKDMQLYEYLLKFSARVVWIALYRSNYKEIEVELSRLFSSKNINSDKRSEMNGSDSDKNVLHGKQLNRDSHWYKQSPVISDIFLNKDKPELLLACKMYTNSCKGIHITGLDAVLTLPEELLKRIGLTVGILGESRNDFEAMLHVKQVQQKSLEEEEIAKAYAKSEQVEKPSVKMYEYLRQLQTSIDLSMFSIDETSEILEEIRFHFINHIEDSKRAFVSWRSIKSS